jgi:hypothetical protein
MGRVAIEADCRDFAKMRRRATARKRKAARNFPTPEAGNPASRIEAAGVPF